MKVLDRLERWAQRPCNEGASVFWLYGGAGAGKSAIMQTLAERWATQGLGLGGFFFWRGDASRNNTGVLIPTLVYQLVQCFPSTLDVLRPIIERDPLIFKKSFQVQLLNLLVRPLEHLVQLGSISNASQSPRIFLIDGLDECDNSDQQREVIQAAATVCHKHRIPVKFLIASRPEQAISLSFGLYTEANYALASISLSNDSDAPSDIRRFIEADLSKIRSQHPFKQMISSQWPDSNDIERLVKKSSSHFIYASTAMKYIWSAKESPVRSLQVVLGLEVSRTITPFAELDALYHHILGSSAHLDKVLQIIGHCVHSLLYDLYKLSSTNTVCLMLDCSNDDLFIFLADMAPLVAISKYPIGDGKEELNVRLLHASLSDFLGDQSRSHLLYLNKEVYLASRLERCLQLADIGCQARRGQDCSTSIWDSPSLGQALYRQIIKTIRTTGHLAVTQEVLGRYSLLQLFEWRLGLDSRLEEIYDVLLQFFIVSLAIHSIVSYIHFLSSHPNC